MPLLIAGIAWLAEFLAGLLATVVFWWTKYVVKRLAILAAACAAVVASTAVFYSALGALANAVLAATPPYFGIAVELCVPSNLHACATAIASAHVARLVYCWQYRLIFMKANVSFGA